MANKLAAAIRNILPVSWYSPIGKVPGNLSGSPDPRKNIGNTIMPIPLQRMVQSVSNWRQGTKEAEYYIPFRVTMQQLYNDLIDEPHLAACMERRMDLTLLRDYSIVDEHGNDIEEWTKWLKEAGWFTEYQRYVLTGMFRGYTLISLGDIVSNDVMTNALPDLKMLEHSVVSPDRMNVGSVVYAINGVSWQDDDYKDWHIYVKTAPEIGMGACGYGLLHKVAIPAILLRANLTDNANYNEKFGQPVTWGKTNKQDDERADFFNDLKNMGSSATFVTDLTDEIQFLLAPGGDGYKTFPDLEMRCQKMISKNILGHSDVMDSIPKRSGSAEGNSQTPTTPVLDALSDITSKDGKFLQPYINELLRKMRKLGVGIPEGATFKYKNDDEEEWVKEKDFQNKLGYANIAKTMKEAGLQMDAAAFTEKTSIPCKER